MPLSWNEIKSRAAAFVKEWEAETNEHAEAKSFWDEFFYIFDTRRRKLAAFEYHVKKLNNKDGYIDLFWPGMLIVEHKSRGKSLDKAHGQVLDYFHGIPDAELPRYILVSDFCTFRLYDLDEGSQTEFPVAKLVEHVHLFGFIAGYQRRTYKEQDPVNMQAAELMGRLHDKLKADGYGGHELELYLVRLVFLLFADDTGIFEKGIFYDYLELKTREDGSDLAGHLAQLFDVLNTPRDKRMKLLDESLDAFPYVNGKLFEERLPVAAFDASMRKTLKDCCSLDWGKISPAIFGSLFQSVMDEKARRNLGAHYTSEKNIMKLIQPLFLDELRAEFETLKQNKAKLLKFHEKISGLRFLDPACGCGNFLIIAYRELRLLEVDVIKQLLKLQGFREEVLRGARMDASYLVKCNVDQFYGIEYEEFPAQIARTAMWLMDHQMNMLVTDTFGEYFVRLPLQKAATIVHGNALRVDWQSLIEPMPWEKGEAKYDYIFGNPPFVGKHYQNEEQKKDISLVFSGVKGAGSLDYVACWYLKSAQYLEKTSHHYKLGIVESNASFTRCAFVSTNSISQGEQVGLLWNELFNHYHIKITFAHRTFKWGNEARGNAAVHVVIIGFANFNYYPKKIYEYDRLNGEPHELKVKNINPYLVEGKDEFVLRRLTPICNVPKMIWGNKPVDGGNLIIEDEELADFVAAEPASHKYIKQLMGATEFLYNQKRWCLWLVNAGPEELKKMPLVTNRIDRVRKAREASVDPGARKLSLTPSTFRDTNNPDRYIVIPEVSSENRRYIPIGFLDENVIPTNLLQLIPNPSLFHFGVLTSLMHMSWVKQVCGRLKSDFRYSNSIVYNNFPWPENPSEKQKQAVEAAAQGVLDARAQFPDASLADLYDPNTMPPVLVKAHQALDRAVDLCYRPQPFASETKRIEYLFELYDKYVSGMFGEGKKKGTKTAKAKP
ncbi:MAG: DNA methyltransferase [Flavisolibacter sp.]